MKENNLTPFRNRSRWSPFDELNSLQREISQLFDSMSSPASNSSLLTQGFAPPCDIEEDDGSYVASFDMPGMDKDNIHIEVNGNELLISGERMEEKKEDKKNRHVSERYYGRIQRSLTLPQSVNAESIEAQYKDGVLKLVLPKSESAKPRRIEIKEGEPGLFGKLLGREKGESKNKQSETAAKNQAA
jgi:HSP20 family protein